MLRLQRTAYVFLISLIFPVLLMAAPAEMLTISTTPIGPTAALCAGPLGQYPAFIAIVDQPVWYTIHSATATPSAALGGLGGPGTTMVMWTMRPTSGPCVRARSMPGRMSSALPTRSRMPHALTSLFLLIFLVASALSAPQVSSPGAGPGSSGSVGIVAGKIWKTDANGILQCSDRCGGRHWRTDHLTLCDHDAGRHTHWRVRPGHAGHRSLNQHHVDGHSHCLHG